MAISWLVVTALGVAALFILGIVVAVVLLAVGKRPDR